MSWDPGLSYPTKGMLCDLDCPFLPQGPGLGEPFSDSTKCPWIRRSWASSSDGRMGGLVAGATAACDRSVQQPSGALFYDVAVRHQTWNSAILAAKNVLCRGKVNYNLFMKSCIRSSQMSDQS